MYTLTVLVYYKKRQSVDFWMDRAKNAVHRLNIIAGTKDVFAAIFVGANACTVRGRKRGT
jgi:hypothetical protein